LVVLNELGIVWDISGKIRLKVPHIRPPSLQGCAVICR
jgi:hypothetical protein